MNEVSENIQLLLDDILLFHEELERVFTMEKGIFRAFYANRYNTSSSIKYVNDTPRFGISSH